MASKDTQVRLEERWNRIKTAVSLGEQDRVPVVPLGDAFAARVTGRTIADLSTKPDVALQSMVETFTSLGAVDGVQHATYNVHALSMLWLSKLKVPGRDLGEDEMWQVEELELMEPEDYGRIAEEGFAAWVDRFYEEHVPGAREAFGAMVASIPGAIETWESRGIPVLSPAIVTVPYEYFCGGRSMRAFILDLHRRPDDVAAAMDATLPFLKEQARQIVRGLGLQGIWIGGWRSASEFLSPKLWERFVFPYYKEMVDVVLEEGAIAVLHFDANWTRDLERFKELPKGRCVLSLDGATDIFKAKEVLGDHMCIMGDVPPAMLTLAGPETVSEYSRRLIEELGPNGFILAQGCDIPPDAKPENVRAMIEAVQD